MPNRNFSMIMRPGCLNYNSKGDAMYNNKDYFLVAGGAQTPRNTNLNDVYQTVSVQLLVNKKTKIVEDANVNVISDLTAGYFRDSVIGYCVDDPIEPLLDYLKDHMLTPATGSTIQALRSAVLRYRESKWYRGR